LLKERHLHKFGDFTLDPVAKVLFRCGEPVHLTRKAVETLLVLVENAGRVLTKDEIMTAVWTDRVVDEANLAQNIAVVRKALGTVKGDTAHSETFPGRGYRIEGPAILAGAPPVSPVVLSAPSPPPPPTRRPIRLWAISAGLLTLAAAGLFLFSRFGKSDRPEEPLYRVEPVTRLRGKEFQPALD